MYFPKKVCAFSRLFNHTIQFYSQTVLALSVNICFRLPLCSESKWEEWWRAIDFNALLLDLPLIHLQTDNLSLGSLEKLNLCYNYNKEEITTPPQTYLRYLYAWEATSWWCLLYCKRFLLLSLKIIRKLPITVMLEVQVYLNRSL